MRMAKQKGERLIANNKKAYFDYFIDEKFEAGIDKASADFWQFVAKLFKNDLKEEYDATDKDRIIERVITLVEAGQL